MRTHEDRNLELGCFLEQLIDLKKLGCPVDDEIALTLKEFMRCLDLVQFDVWAWLRDWVDAYEDAVGDGSGEAFMDWVRAQPCCSG